MCVLCVCCVCCVCCVLCVCCVVCGVWCVVCGVWCVVCVVCGVWCVVCGAWCVVRGACCVLGVGCWVLCVVCCVLCVVCCVLCVVCCVCVVCCASVCPCVRVSVCLCVGVSVCLCVCVSVCLCPRVSVCLSVSPCVFLPCSYLSVSVGVCGVCRSVCCLCLSFFRLFCQSLCVSVSLSVCFARGTTYMHSLSVCLLLARSQEQFRSRPTYSAPVGALVTLLVTMNQDEARRCTAAPLYVNTIDAPASSLHSEGLTRAGVLAAVCCFLQPCRLSLHRKASHEYTYSFNMLANGWKMATPQKLCLYTVPLSARQVATELHQLKARPKNNNTATYESLPHM